MTTTTITTSSNVQPPSYHTVTICADLPKINKYYSIDEINDVPPDDYWISQIDKKDDRNTRYKKLTVVQSARIEPNWEDFLERMRLEIDKNVKNDITQLLTSTFSTTTSIESLLSSFVLMNTCQKYFDYECYITKCGIRNVHFLGTLDDWKLLRKKIRDLKNYINAVLPIIDQFIRTYQNDIDQEFWNKVMDIEHVGGGRSGKIAGTYISGWFLRLCYGLHSKSDCEIKQIKLNTLNVSVEVNNEVTNESKTCYLVGGFHGVDSRDERHKPIMGLAIIDDTSTIRPFKQK
ncbi:hypothetical protein I4U23_003504 [Adineta vaga]|nr:hypothetical protein I4U23_003504 [Adineta vaga]